MIPSHTKILMACCLLALTACGSSSDSIDNADLLSSQASVGFTVEDLPVDNLSTATLTLSSLKLIRAGGAATQNLLAEPRTFEFLGLSTKQALLALVPSVPAGTYEQVELTVHRAAARDLSGTPLTVNLRTPTARAAMTDFGGRALMFDGSGFVPCRIDIDLNQSFDDDPASAADIAFDLNFSAATEIAPAFDEFRARIVSITPATSSFLARILDDSAPNSTFGLLEIIVEDGDFMAFDDGRDFVRAADFLKALSLGEVAQISGSMLDSGAFDASRVVTEDDFNGHNHQYRHGYGWGRSQIEIEGDVKSINLLAGTFELLISEIEKGTLAVQPVLDALGNPASITVSFDETTRLFGTRSSTSGTNLVATALEPGMEIDVRFATFEAPQPFAATSIQIGDGMQNQGDRIQYGGVVSATGLLPASFELTLNADHPAVVSGLVTAPVTVSLSAAPVIVLDSGPDPTLTPDSIVTKLCTHVVGELSGLPESATLTASLIELKPGELDGTLLAVDLGASTITVRVNEIQRTFGGGTIPSGDVTFAVQATAHIHGALGAMTLLDLDTFFAGLGAGETVVVEVEGLAAGSDEWLSWDLRVETSVTL